MRLDFRWWAIFAHKPPIGIIVREWMLSFRRYIRKKKLARQHQLDRRINCSAGRWIFISGVLSFSSRVAHLWSADRNAAFRRRGGSGGGGERWWRRKKKPPRGGRVTTATLPRIPSTFLCLPFPWVSPRWACIKVRESLDRTPHAWKLASETLDIPLFLRASHFGSTFWASGAHVGENADHRGK